MDPGTLEGFRAGARDALERVYWEQIDDVEAVVRAGLHRSRYFSAANLADLVQEIFAKAFSPRARAAYDGSREYKPYLRQLARNTLVDWLRERGREVIDSVTAETLLDSDPLGTSVDGILFPPELVATTRDFVSGLTPSLKRVHEHRFLASKSQEQAAKELGISRQTIRTLERRLLEGLRREIRRTERKECSPTFSQLKPSAKPY